MVETHGVAGDSEAKIRAAPHHGGHAAATTALGTCVHLPPNDERLQVKVVSGILQLTPLPLSPPPHPWAAGAMTCRPASAR